VTAAGRLRVNLMTRSLLLVLLLSGALVRAQNTAPAAGASSLSGIVVSEPGDQPLKKVLVQVVAEDQKQGGNYTALTDSDGRFHIESVVPGRYRAYAERTGFVGVNERGMRSETNVIAVQSSRPVDDIFFRMLPTAVVSGRITDEDGDPISGVRVLALRKIPGKTKRENMATETTNDLGEYRLAGLFPGQYWIAAIPAPDFRDYEKQTDKIPPAEDHADDHPARDSNDTRYLTTYYPGTYDAAQASAVALKAGDQMPVNLTLLPARTYRVRGIVTGLAPGQRPSVELVSRLGDSIHAAEVDPDGRFEVRGIGPGSYLLRVADGNNQQALTARQEISVVASDVEGLRLAPQPSFKLSGHLRVDGRPSTDLTQFVANLRPAELPDDPGLLMSQEFFGANAPVDRFGNFEWKDVNPGNYVVRLYGGDTLNDFFLESIKLAGRDVETGFAASGPLTLDAVVSANGGTIDGAVLDMQKMDMQKNDGGHFPVSNATVVAVPEEKFRKLPDRFESAQTDQHGRFAIRGLAPGRYTLFAWQDVEDNVYRDPDFLKSQEANGEAVKIEEGSHQTVELKLSPVGEEWR